MMLPSGNDAAQAISENLGRLLGTANAIKQEYIGVTDTARMASQSRLLKKQGTVESVGADLGPGITQKIKQQKKGSQNKPFLERMNKLAESLGMDNSTYCNPHGLMNKYNCSTAADVAMLVAKASHTMPRFVEVFSTPEYSAQIERHGESETLEWNNTHKGKDDPRFVGGKTGVTVAAGPCLTTLKKLKGDKMVVIVVLNCIFR